MKTKITKTLALLAAFCGLQLFTATPAMATTKTWTQYCYEKTYLAEASAGITQYDKSQNWFAFRVNLTAESMNGAQLVKYGSSNSNYNTIKTTSDGKYCLEIWRSGKTTLTKNSTVSVTAGTHNFAMLVRRGASDANQLISVILYMDGSEIVKIVHGQDGVSDSETFAGNPMANFTIGQEGKDNRITLYRTANDGTLPTKANGYATDTATMAQVMADANELFPPLVAYFYGDTLVDGATYTGAGGVQYTLSLNDNTAVSGGIQISASKGVSVKRTDGNAFPNKATTVIIKYTNFDTSSLTSTDAKVLIVNHNAASTYKDMIGAASTAGGNIWALWNNTTWSQNKTTSGAYGSTAGDVKQFAFSWAQTATTAAAVGARIYMNGANKYEWSGLHGDQTIDAIWIGGPNEGTGVTPATGMKILGIAVFSGALSDADIASFSFPAITYTATISGDTKFSEITTWAPARPTTFEPYSQIVINNTATAKLTMDEALEAPINVSNSSGAALTLAITDKVVSSKLNCSGAAGGVTLEVAGVNGAELARYAVVGAPYSYWTPFKGSVTGTLTVTCPTVPTGYSIASGFVTDYGLRFVVTAESAKLGSVSMNIHNGTALSGEGNHGLHPIALADWGNLKVANNGTATQGGLTFTLSSSVSGYGVNNTPPDMIQKQYMDDNNDGVTRKVTVSGMTSKGFAKYRAIVYYCTDSANINFAPLSVTVGGNTDWYAGPTAGSTTVGYTVKGSQNVWGETGPNHNANALGEGVNALVTDVMTADSITLNFLKKSGQRATPCAIQIVEVGVVAKIGDTKYSSLAEAEAAVQSGETIQLLMDWNESLSTTKTFTLDLNGKTLGGTLAVESAGVVTLNYNDGTLSSTITGSGTIVYNGFIPTTVPTGITAADWTGTVWLENKTGVAALELDVWGNANSTVRLTGIQAYFNTSDHKATTVTFPGTLEVKNTDSTGAAKNYALDINNGWSGATVAFGALKGDGLIKDTTKSATQTFTFDDVSEFAGSITLSHIKFKFGTGDATLSSGSVVVTAAGSATVASGKTWTAPSGIKVNGKIGGAGTLASATTFGDGAEIDARTAQLTANGTLAFGANTKVRVATAPTVETPVKVLSKSGSGDISTTVSVYVGDGTTAESGTFKLFYGADGIYVTPYTTHNLEMTADTTWADLISGQTFAAHDNIAVTANGHKLTFTEKVSATYGLVINGNVTIAAWDALYVDGCWEETIATFGQVSIPGTITSELKTGFNGAFTTTANSIKLRAQNKEVISINIAGGSGGGTTGETSPDANKVTGTGFYGIAPTLGDSWNNIDGQFQGEAGTTRTLSINAPNAYDGKTTINRPTMSLSATGKNTWQCGSIDNPFLRGYLDDGNGVTVMVHGIPYTKYDVIVYATSDDASIKLAPVTINGTQYTFADGVTKPGSAVWGQGQYATPEVGKNALRINDCEGGTLTVNATRVYSPNGRATLCAVQVICKGEVVVSSKYVADVTAANVTWTTGDDEGLTKYGQTWASSQLSTLTLTNTVNSTLTFNPTEVLTGLTFKVVSAANTKMTIPYSSLEKLSFTYLDFSEAFGKVEIDMSSVTEGSERVILAGELTGPTNVTYTSTGDWGAYADATGIHMAPKANTSRNNPVTGEAKSFERSFFGTTDASWNTLANWRTVSNGIWVPATKIPGVSGSSGDEYPKIMIDGDDSAQDTVTVNTLEGYNIQYAFLNGAQVTASTLTKMQGSGVTQFIWVDGTSSFKVNALGDNQNWQTLNLYVAAENGIAFPAFGKGATLNYYLKGNGSVKFTGAVTAGTHTIKQMDLAVGMDNTKPAKHVEKKTLATIGATGTTVTFAKASDIVVNLDNKSVNPTWKDTVPTVEDTVGTYTIATESTGVYAYVVQYADQWDIVDPLTVTLTDDTAWSSIVWKDAYNHEFTNPSGAHQYKLTAGDYAATFDAAPTSGSTVEIVTGTLTLNNAEAIAADTPITIDNGATLLVTASGLKANKVTNNGTIAFNGGSEALPIEIAGDADFGTMTLAAGAYVKNTDTGNRKHLVTGSGATSYYQMTRTSGAETGFYDGSALTNLTLVAKSKVWLERVALTDVRIKADAELCVNSIDPVIMALSGTGSVTKYGTVNSVTINCAEAAEFSGDSSLPFVIGGTAEQTLSGNYTGALTVNANASAALKVGATYALNVNNAGTLRLIDNETTKTTLTAATFNNSGTLDLSGTGINTLAIGTLTSFGTVTWPAEVAGTVKITGGGATRDFSEIKTKLSGFTGAVEIAITETLAENAAGQVALTGAPAGAKIVLTRIDGTVIEGTATEAGSFTQTVTVLAYGAACLYDYTFTNTISTAQGSRNTGTLSHETGWTMEYTDDALLLWCSPWQSLKDTLPTLDAMSVAMYGKVSATNNTIFISFGSKDRSKLLFLATNEDGSKVNVCYYNGSVNVLNQITVPHMTTASHLYVFSKVNSRTLDIYLDGALWQRVTTDFDLALGATDHSGVQFGSSYGGDVPGYSRVPTTDKLADVGTMRVYDYVVSAKQMAALKTEFPYDSPDTYARTVDTATTNWVATAAWAKGGKTFDAPDAEGAVKVKADANTTVSVNLGTETAVNYEKVTFAGEKPISLVLAQDNTIPVKAMQFEFETDVTVTPEAIDLGSAQTTSISANGKLTIDLRGIDCGVYTTNFVQEITGTCTDSGLVEAGKLAIIKPTQMYGRDMTIIYQSNKKYAVEVALKSDVTAMYWKPTETVLTNTTHLTDSTGKADYIWWQTMPITVNANSSLTSITGDCQNTTFLVNSGISLNVGTLRTVKIGGAGNVTVKLTADEYVPGAVITAFVSAAESTAAVTTVLDPNGNDVTYQATINGNMITMKKEAKIGTTYYFVLADAIEAAGADATVTLCTNVTGFAYTLDKNITLDGDIWEIAGSGFTVAAEKTLTIAGGYIGMSRGSGTIVLTGGKFTEEGTNTWAECMSTANYHFADLASLSELYESYKHQIIAGSETRSGEAVYPAAVVDGGTTNYVGDLAFTKQELVDKKIITSTEASDADVVKALSAKGGNQRPTWENVVLGLDNEDPLAKPVPTPVQGTDPTKLKLKLDNLKVSTTSGAKVTYKVTTTTSAGSETKTIDDLEAEFTLPESGVSYYTFEVTVTPAK